jgi:hypothetical protein
MYINKEPESITPKNIALDASLILMKQSCLELRCMLDT